MSESMIFDTHRVVTRMTEAGRARPLAPAARGTAIAAILRRDEADDATRRLIAMAENPPRSAITTLEWAHGIARLTTLSKSQGITQKQIAHDLHIPQARLTKYIALAKAPEEIQTLSSHEGIQDLELLYLLKKTHEEHPDQTLALLAQWRRDQNRPPLRPLVQQLVDALRRPRTRTPEPAPDTESGHAAPRVDPPRAPAHPGERKHMTIRHDDVRPLFIDDFQALAGEAGTRLVYTHTPDGIEAYAWQGERVYQLYTRERTPRRFKSADTAIRFARTLPGVDRLLWEGLDTPHPHDRHYTRF